VKKMNGKVLEIEPGTVGYQQLDAAGFNRALNAWAKRRGIPWESHFRRPLDLRSKKKSRPK
jgi:phage-related protein